MLINNETAEFWMGQSQPLSDGISYQHIKSIRQVNFIAINDGFSKKRAVINVGHRMNIFNEPTFAWQLLQWEIAIEMNESLSGQAIAKLLELYMRGVEKMNSLMDIREAYFKNKVQSLMMKNNVVKTLNRPPMAKKQKPLEISAKVQTKKAVKAKQQTGNQKKVEALPSVQPNPTINTFALQEKKRQIQMRLAYQAHQSSRQNLNNIYNQHIHKEETFTNKVKNILNDHQQRLKERITRRKLRTATYRSRPEDTSDNFPVQENSAEKKEREESFQSKQTGNKHEKKNVKVKRHRSMQNKVNHQLSMSQSPKKLRKSFIHESNVNIYETGNEKEQQNQYQKIEFQEVQIKVEEKAQENGA